MLALVQITPWHWFGFIICIIVFLALDLGVFHRQAHAVRFKEALLWSAAWFCLAMVFALALRPLRGEKESLEFLTGYIIELSLSMDNVFVIALIFGTFQIPTRYQHRVLFWGILGALIMRGFMIGVGIALISWLHWFLYVLGAFVLFTGVKTLFVKTDVKPENNWTVRFVRKFYPVTPNLDGQKFLTMWEGKRALTPLALVLVLVETTDLIFALDSIPAIFAITTKSFIVFTSNVFAILGLRSLYFVLAGAIKYFRYLKVGLSIVLIFIGFKMLFDPHDQAPSLSIQFEIPISVSLGVVAGIILISMLASVIAARFDKTHPPSKPTENKSVPPAEPPATSEKSDTSKPP
jgi:tellurite resistance protein TerC